MKKTLSINIRGIVFNIDEDAYQKLNNYLTEIYRHYKNQPGCDEIVSDIENRVVELFQERLSENKQLVTISDVDEVIGILGHPADFDRELEDDTPNPVSGNKRTKGNKRLYRDVDNRMIGGVCSGLGAYFGIDTVWIRLAFVVLTVIFVGTGILLYVIFWLIIPPAITVSEKLEMKGDPIDIDHIEKSVRKEMKDVKEKIGDFAEQAKQTFKKK